MPQDEHAEDLESSFLEEMLRRSEELDRDPRAGRDFEAIMIDLRKQLKGR